MSIFSKTLRELILSHGMTNAEASVLAGFYHNTMWKYVSGCTTPSKKSVEAIEDAFNLPRGDLERLIIRKTPERSANNNKRGDTEQEILRAWKRGDRTPYEVAEITGYSLSTVARYLPLGLEQEYKWRDA